MLQTYPNKDLVVVCEGDYATLNQEVFTHDNITFIPVSKGSSLSLGERRNISIQHCKGEYFCQWDDDDWFHNQRLEIQITNLLESKKPAQVLNRILLYDQAAHQGYLSSERYWEGTLLCKTELINDYTRYPNLNRAEDNSLVVKLIKRDLVHALAAPYLYTYLFHGTNTWDSHHFQQLFNAGYPLGPDLNSWLKKTITGEYAYAEACKLSPFL
jgi:glycosyltransferase involved in cell wall biosynthesis